MQEGGLITNHHDAAREKLCDLCVAALKFSNVQGELLINYDPNNTLAIPPPQPVIN